MVLAGTRLRHAGKVYLGARRMRAHDDPFGPTNVDAYPPFAAIHVAASEAPLKASAPGRLFLVSAPSGAGKTSLVARLIADDPRLRLSVSYTTRPRRPSERDGVNYHFVDAETFDRMVAEGAFLEHAEVFGHRYGTGRDWVTSHLDGGEDVILEIDWQGAQQIKRVMPEAISIFVLPPSRNALLARLRGRGEDDEATIERRTRAAREEIAHHASSDYLVVNDEFDVAAAELRSIVTAERLRTVVQRQRLAALIEDLLA